MPTATENRLFDTAKIRLPGALDAALFLELFILCEEFFRETSCWKELLPFTATPATDPYITHPAQYTFDVTPPAGSVCVSLFGVYDAAERPHAASMSVPGEIVLETPPTASTTYYAYVSLTVAEPAGVDSYPTMPDWAMERHWPAFLDGLLFRMMSQPGKPYTSAQTALFHGRRWQSRKSQAKVEAMRNNLYGAQAWSFPQTFNRR
jgi:hypothetical protein